jgi:hypothetical protein
MSTRRRSITENLPDPDSDDLAAMASQFKPTPAAANAPRPEEIAQVAQKVQFTSREPVGSPQVAPLVPSMPHMTPRRPPRIHRTGRSVQFSCKASQSVIDAFYELADANGWMVAETFENAVLALQEKLQDEIVRNAKPE